MKAIIILLVLMINNIYASNQFYSGDMPNRRNINIACQYYHAFGESNLTFNRKPILKVNCPSNCAKHAKNHYGFMQMHKISVPNKFAVNLKDTTNNSRKPAFHDNKQSRRWNQKVYKDMQKIITNVHYDFRHKTHFIAYRSMTFYVNSRQNCVPKNYLGKSLDNEPLFDPFKKITVIFLCLKFQFFL